MLELDRRIGGTVKAGGDPLGAMTAVLLEGVLRYAR